MSSAPHHLTAHRNHAVDAPIERAFRVFTENLSSWWPADYHIGQLDMATAILEPREGGRWYEHAVDGSECGVGCWPGSHRTGWS